MTSMRQERCLIMENVPLIFRNFEGREGQYNRAGDRNFSVLLDDETAEAMASDGWNVKYLKPREEGDTPQAYLQVSLNYNKGRPPRVNLITSRGRTPLTEREVEMLDVADIKGADVFICPYDWNVGDRSGTKAYLQSLFVTIEEDPLEKKYLAMEDELEMESRRQEGDGGS